MKPKKIDAPRCWLGIEGTTQTIWMAAWEKGDVFGAKVIRGRVMRESDYRKLLRAAGRESGT